ncbi:hypothetical protein [Tepidimicrobium xylanilyticum]|uniref:Uncharacterized protein n=1 Tax=Tepidimicrobium xylanilyticum TaxID=1123352 RepID=A0A1H2T6T8_9FIRM|nr:hypothetical protein [Tepidimicrobium xylanilyticum]GMG96025.1 hypothetical protein EN5CB1_08510 [Tepidimicrobium xylanilyticum]SDW38989.1 hypothetical protein SAMN05660923_00632 [Tepidimicrobium xylanilyticum]
METRVSRMKRIRRERRVRNLKYLIIIFTLFILYYGIKMVNDYIIYLDYLERPIIFDLDLKDGKLYLFGESYLIDLKILKRSE